MVLWGDLQEGFYWVSLELQWKAWEGREVGVTLVPGRGHPVPQQLSIVF